LSCKLTRRQALSTPSFHRYRSEIRTTVWQPFRWLFTRDSSEVRRFFFGIQTDEMPVPSFPLNILERICDVLADSNLSNNRKLPPVMRITLVTACECSTGRLTPGVAQGLRHKNRGHGIDRRLLDPLVPEARRGWFGSTAGRCAAGQACAWT